MQIFKDATLFLSHSTPSISTVIPAMDYINKHLATAILNPDYLITIKAALVIGKMTLNRYYNKTDHFEVFCIAMGMIFFDHSGLSYIFMIILVLHSQHKLRYFEKAGWEEAWIKEAEETENIFDDLPALQEPKVPELCNELAKYLSTKQDLHVKDGLHWWHEHKDIYPRLYQMVLDYLSIPGTLFPLFSMDCLTNSYLSYISWCWTNF